jgi:hypothetical protein
VAAGEVLEAEGAGRSGQGAVVVLPWQAYLDPGFTADRIVSNPARVFFPGAIVSDDAGLPGLQPSAASDRIAAALRQPNAADVLAAEDVRWVVTVPGADERFGDAPGFVRLVRVDGVSVYRNARHGTSTSASGQR